MAFRVTEMTALLNEAKFAEAADLLATKIAGQGGCLAAAARELKVNYRTITRWLSLLQEQGLDVRTLASKKEQGERTPPPPKPPAARSSQLTPRDAEKQKKAILDAVQEEGGNCAAAARRLGISRQRMYQRLDALNIREDVQLLQSRAKSA